MRRNSSAAIDRPESPTELIARISAEHDSQFEATGRHRLPAAVVTRDVPTPGSSARRTSTRRLAPLAIGAAVMLVATVVATIVHPTETSVASPELSSALANHNPTPDPALSNTIPPAPASPPPAVVPDPTKAPVQAPVAPKPQAPAAPKPAAPPVGGSGGNGVQAATAKGWTLVDSDEFTGSSVSNKWGVYEGEGNGGNGKRSASAISVGGGLLTITGDSGGTSGGMAWNDNQQNGKWEVRARFPKGDDNYHPVLLLWPDSGWPPEVDFAETTSASNDVSFFLHYSSSNQQVGDTKSLDITQWHNYAVEWVAGRVTGYIDGQQWFQSTDSKTVPTQPMHLAIQLDNFGGVKQQSSMQVDYVRIYK